MGLLSGKLSTQSCIPFNSPSNGPGCRSVAVGCVETAVLRKHVIPYKVEHTSSKALYTRARRLINFPRTWSEQRTSGAWKGHPAHPVPFVFVQKTDKFWFAVNGMRTVRGQRGAGSQFHPYICTFGSQAVREPFGTLMYTRLKMVECRLKGVTMATHITPYWLATVRWLSNANLYVVRQYTWLLCVYCVLYCALFSSVTL